MHTAAHAEVARDLWATHGELIRALLEFVLCASAELYSYPLNKSLTSTHYQSLYIRRIHTVFSTLAIDAWKTNSIANNPEYDVECVHRALSHAFINVAHKLRESTPSATLLVFPR